MHSREAEAFSKASSDDDQWAASNSSSEAADDSVAGNHTDSDANLPSLQVPLRIPLHVLLTFLSFSPLPLGLV